MVFYSVLFSLLQPFCSCLCIVIIRSLFVDILGGAGYNELIYISACGVFKGMRIKGYDFS